MSRKRRNWTKKEEELLRENYPTMGYKVCQLFPTRTKSSVLRKADWMDLKVKRKTRRETKNDRIGYLDIETCVTPDTLILTKKGFKYISDILPGEIVLTHKNKWKKVLKIGKRPCKGKIYDLYHTTGMPLLSITPSHPLWVVETKGIRKGVFNKGDFNSTKFIATWKKGKDLKTTDITTSIILDEEDWHDIEEIYLGNQPKSDHHKSHTIPRSIKVTDTVLKIIGAFLGDGWCCIGKSNQVAFFPGENDKEFLDLIDSFENQVGFRFTRKKKGKMWNFYICSKQLADFFMQFYNAKGEKDLPLIWLNLPTSRFEKIIEGLILSDGYITKKGIPSISNTSKPLFKKISIRMMFSRTNIRIFKKKNTSKGKFKSKKPSYSMHIYNQKRMHIRRWYVLHYSLNRLLQKKERTYTDYVYNLEVEDDNSYIANGIISHNSQLAANFGIIYSWVIKEQGKKKYDSAVITRKEILDGTLDKRVVQDCIDAMKEYTLIYTYYGTKFDVKFIRTRALIHGLDFIPRGEVEHRDLYYLAKRVFRLHRYRLETVCDALGIVGKTHIDQRLWILANTGNPEALKYIYDHNLADVDILERAHEKMAEFETRTRRWL